MAKTGLFDEEVREAAKIFKAMSHPARLEILRYLADVKSCISGDISEKLPLSRTTVNQHLTELKKMNLIRGEIEGVKTNYCLNGQVLTGIRSLLDKFLSDICCSIDETC